MAHWEEEEGGGGSATYGRGLGQPGVTDGGDPRGPRFLPTRRASSGGVELVKHGRVLCHPSGGGVGAGHHALGLGFQKGHAVRVQGACARVRASGGDWERLEARALP